MQLKVILPSEHGSWSLMLTPFILGAGIAVVVNKSISGIGVVLALIAGMSLFLARQPLTLWVRVRRGRAKRADERPARLWSLILLGIAALAGAALIALGRVSILWIGVAAAVILAITLGMVAILGPRKLITELIGVAGLALAAPAAYIAATGLLDATAVIVWALSAIHNIISVLYVRLRIDQQHERASRAQAVNVIVGHLVSLIAVLGAALLGWLPVLVALPLVLLLLRAVIIAWRNPPLDDVKRFGFTEMGVAIGFDLLVIASFILAH